MQSRRLFLIAVLLCFAGLGATANAATLFEGTSLSKFSKEGASGAFTEATDPLGSGKTVFKSVVADPNPRALLLSPAIIEEDDEFWLKTKLLVPSSFPKSIPNGEALLSIYGPPYGGPAPFSLETFGENLSWQRNGKYGWDVPLDVPLPRDEWIGIMVHERFDEEGQGWIELWIDGEKATFFAPGSSWNPESEPETSKLEMATMDESNDEGANEVRLMQSRSVGEAASSTVYFGSLKIGDNRDDVTSPSFNGRKIAEFDANESAEGAVTEVTDPLGSGEQVLQMTVDEEDVWPKTPSDNPRAQLLGPDDLGKGDEFWLGTKFLIPSSFPTLPPGGWMALVGIFGPPYGGAGGPWTLEVDGNHLQWQRNGTYGFDIPWVVTLEKGSWTRLLLHMRMDEEGKGWVEMWINGKRLTFFDPETSENNWKELPETDHLAMSTMDATNNGAPNSARISQYRKKEMFETGTLYFGPLRIGDERADVDY